MSIPGLKDFNQLIDSAQSELEAWSRTPSAASIPASSLDYARDILAAISSSEHIGSMVAGFRNILATLQPSGIPISQISPSLEKLSKLIRLREQKDSRKS